MGNTPLGWASGPAGSAAAAILARMALTRLVAALWFAPCGGVLSTENWTACPAAEKVKSFTFLIVASGRRVCRRPDRAARSAVVILVPWRPAITVVSIRLVSPDAA